jgi:hypothetical protein
MSSVVSSMRFYDETKNPDGDTPIRWICQPCGNCGTPTEDFIENTSSDFAKPLDEIRWYCAGCHRTLKYNLMTFFLENNQDNEALPPETRNAIKHLLAF